MAKKKRSLNEFAKAKMPERKQQTVKGGRKATAAEVDYHSSYIWDAVDVRSSYYNQFEGIIGHAPGRG
jgi:predicted DNA-binding ArsR family transcriptional regulator